MDQPVDPFDYQSYLDACVRGERQALRALYDQEGPRLLGVARRISRDDAMAEDIVHDAFIRIWTHAASFDPARGSARGWIYSITRNLALNYVRDGAREVPFDETDATALRVQITGPDDGVLVACYGKVHRCLERLEPSRRRCILHAYVDGCTHAEIAALLGTPLGTVKAWIRRSLAALRECMG